MSADEFDPFVERLFSRAPNMPDAELFSAEVQARLDSRSRLRGLVLALAGAAGCAVALRETMNLDLSGSPLTGRAVSQGAQAVIANAQIDILTTLDGMGLGGLSLGSMGTMQLFWITAAALIALLAAGAVKLSQEA